MNSTTVTSPAVYSETTAKMLACDIYGISPGEVINPITLDILGITTLLKKTNKK